MNSSKTLTQVITFIAIAIGLVLILMAVQFLNNAPTSQSAAGLIASPANELVGTHQPSPYDEDADLDCWPRQYPTPTSGPNTEPIGIPICDREQSIAGEIVVYPPVRNPTAEAATLVAEMTRVADINPNVVRVSIPWEFSPGFDPEWAALLAGDQVPDQVYGIIQFTFPLDFGIHEKTLALEELGIEFTLGLPPPGTIWYVIIPRTALPVIYDWVNRGELRYAGPIPVDVRVESPAWEYASTHPNDPVPITLTIFEWPGDPSQPIPYLYPQAKVFSGRVSVIESWVDPWDIEALAKLPQTMWIAYRPIEEFCVYAGFDKYCSIEPTPSR